MRAIGQTGGLINSAAAITACSFASFMFSPLSSLRQLGFALVVGITVDALLVRPLLVPCGHWLLCRSREVFGPSYHALLPARLAAVSPTSPTDRPGENAAIRLDPPGSSGRSAGWRCGRRSRSCWTSRG